MKKKNTNYCYDVHRHVMPIILWHVSIPIVRIWHARLRKIEGCLKITEDIGIIALETFLFFSGTLLKSGSFPHARARSFPSHSLFLSPILSHELVQGDTNLGNPICSRGVVWFGRPSAYTDSRISAYQPVRRALCATRSESTKRDVRNFVSRCVNAEAHAGRLYETQTNGFPHLGNGLMFGTVWYLV